MEISKEKSTALSKYVEIALERLEELEDAWIDSRRELRKIIANSYASNMQIVREFGSKETNSQLDEYLVGLPVELKYFIDNCFFFEPVIIDENFSISDFLLKQRQNYLLERKDFDCSFSVTAYENQQREKIGMKNFLMILGKLNLQLELHRE